MALTRQAIVAAGHTILDAYGLGDLSMRRVADTLGVQAGALYYHVPNKQSLLAAVADDLLADAPRPAADLPVAEWLTAWADGLRAVLLARRDAAELVASSLALGLTVDPTVAGRDRLEAAGLPRPRATMTALLHLVLGHVVEEQTKAQMHALGVLGSFDADAAADDFAWGVATLVRGITA